MNEQVRVEILPPEAISREDTLDTLVTLYLGLNVSQSNDPCGRGYIVPRDAVQAFVKDVVSIAFPDGFTIIHADGGWRDNATGKTILEPALVIQVVVSGRSKDSDVRFTARCWKQEAFQDAVMVTRQAVQAVEFV